MGDLVYHYANYSDNLDELEALVNAIGDNGRERAIAEAREKIRRVTTAKKSLGLRYLRAARQPSTALWQLPARWEAGRTRCTTVSRRLHSTYCTR